MSIKKIAEIVGVSPATVSRVLNNPNYKCASKNLPEKIWKAAIELDYTPNKAARNLKLGRNLEEDKTFYINILITKRDSYDSDPFLVELLRVIESEIHKSFCILSKIWYEPTFSNVKNNRGVELNCKLMQMFSEVEGKSDGLIIIGKCNKNIIDGLTKKYKSVVSVNKNCTNSNVDEVFCNGYKISEIALEYLIKLGHQSIGYVGECYNNDKYRGFVQTLKKHDIELDPGWVIETKEKEAEGYEIMAEFFKMEYVPTAIYCSSDVIAIGMLKYINDYKKNSFNSFSIISSDDIEEAQNTRPMLTTVRIPKEELGKYALFLLLDRLKGGHKSNTKIEVDGHLIIRNSCMSPNESKWFYCI